jgi:hypothetical protein
MVDAPCPVARYVSPHALMRGRRPLMNPLVVRERAESPCIRGWIHGGEGVRFAPLARQAILRIAPVAINSRAECIFTLQTAEWWAENFAS